MPPVTPKEPKKSSKKTPEKPESPIKYPEIFVSLALGEDAITATQAKEMLGWEETDSADAAILVDENKKKIFCRNNGSNRPLNESWARQLGRDILNRNWADSRNGEGMSINGETIIIGCRAAVLSAQHRLIGLILAEQMWENDETGTWKKKWETAPTIEGMIVYGVSEDPRVTRTLDNVRPRTLSDVLFCDPTIYSGVATKDRVKLVKVVENAVKLLWHRTGADANAFAPKATHSEAVDFIQRHNKILKCAKHMYKEEEANPIKPYVSTGYAAALLYLMSASDTEVVKYSKSHSEKHIDFGQWDLACEFFQGFAKNLEAFKPIRTAIATLADPETGTGGSLAEKLAIIIKGWNLYKSGEEITAAGLTLEYSQEDDQDPVLAETPLVGGIDIGEPDEEDDEDEETEEDNTPEAHKKRAAEIKAKKLAEMQGQAQEPPAQPPFADFINGIRNQHPGQILLFAGKAGYKAFATDANVVCKIIGEGKPKVHEGILKYTFSAKFYEEVVTALNNEGLPAMVVTEDEKGEYVFTPVSQAKPVSETTPTETPEGEPKPETTTKKPKGPKLKGGL